MKLTAIIRDETPLQIDEPCSVRRVTIDLTAEQEAALALRGDREAYRTVFLETEPRPPLTCPYMVMDLDTGKAMKRVEASPGPGEYVYDGTAFYFAEEEAGHRRLIEPPFPPAVRRRTTFAEGALRRRDGTEVAAVANVLVVATTEPYEAVASLFEGRGELCGDPADHPDIAGGFVLDLGKPDGPFLGRQVTGVRFHDVRVGSVADSARFTWAAVPDATGQVVTAFEPPVLPAPSPPCGGEVPRG